MDTTTVVATLVAYKLLLVGVGWWAQSRTQSDTDFFLGGRRLGPVVSSLSYAASAASAWTLLGFSGATYALGVSAIWIVVGLCGACALNWFVIAPRMMVFAKTHNLLTVPDFVAHGATGAHRRALAAASSLIILVAFLLYVAAQFQGAGSTFHVSFDLDAELSVAIGGAVVLVYTWLGGFWAVSVTDAIQGIVMVIAAVALPWAAVDAVGGFSALASAYSKVATAKQLSLSAGNAGLVAIGFVAGQIGVGFGMFGQPHLLARFMATRDEKAIRTARVIATGWYVLVFGGMYIAALAGRLLVPELTNGEQLFFALNQLLFHPFVAAILLAAVLSAVMSTADSMLLVSAAAVAHDLGLAKRFPGRELLISRLVMAGLSAAAVMVAIVMPASIFERVLFAWTAIGAAFGPLLFMRLFGAAIAPLGVWLGVLGGFVSAVALYLGPDSPGDWMERGLPFVIGFAGLWLGTLTSPGPASGGDADPRRR